MTSNNTQFAKSITAPPGQPEGAVTVQPFPSSVGTYALILHLSAARPIGVGKLGLFEFPAGHYLYVGSAFGPGGLAGRLNRHVATSRPGSKPHWHIDHLRRSAPICEIWFAEHTTHREHDWAALVASLTRQAPPAPRFGASDCRCPAHLFYFTQPPDFVSFQAVLVQAFPADPPLQRRLYRATNDQP